MNEIDQTWLNNYELSKSYYYSNGNLLINIDYNIDNIRLGLWISRQRMLYKKNKLSEEKILKLNTISMVWDVFEYQWNKNFDLAEEYFNNNGNLLVPSSYEVDSQKLGRWLDTQRNYYKHNKLTKEKIEKLNAIGMVWHKFTNQWENSFLLAKKYFDTNGHLFMDKFYEINGVKLGYWINDQRKAFKNGILSRYRIGKLESIGIIWSELDYLWEQNFLLAEQYYINNGNLFIPKRYKVKDINLGSWLGTQKSDYKNNRISSERIKRLESIGMLWHVTHQSQTSYQEQAIYYYIKRYFPDSLNRFRNLGFELDIYISELKLAIEYDGYTFHKDKNRDIEKNNNCKKHNITLIRIREPNCPILNDSSIDFNLENLSTKELENNIIKIFNYINENYKYKLKPIISVNRDTQKIYKQYIQFNDIIWEEKFTLAQKYYKKFHNLLIPNDYIMNGVKVGIWLGRQRNCYKEGKLTENKIKKLESINMIWDVLENQWDICYEAAKKYFLMNNNLYIEERFIDENNIRLGNWIVNQRQDYRNNKISTIRVQKLEEIGMVWNIIDDRWNKNYLLAENYFNTNGNLLVHGDYEVNNIKLGSWISEQRKAYNKKKLDPICVEKLNSIGMIWDVLNYRWNLLYNLAEKYFTQNSNLLIPHDYEVSNIKLGLWISRHRRLYKDNKLSLDKINLLNSIGMVWSIRKQ